MYPIWLKNMDNEFTRCLRMNNIHAKNYQECLDKVCIETAYGAFTIQELMSYDNRFAMYGTFEDEDENEPWCVLVTFDKDGNVAYAEVDEDMY